MFAGAYINIIDVYIGSHRFLPWAPVHSYKTVVEQKQPIFRTVHLDKRGEDDKYWDVFTRLFILLSPEIFAIAGAKPSQILLQCKRVTSYHTVRIYNDRGESANLI